MIIIIIFFNCWCLTCISLSAALRFTKAYRGNTIKTRVHSTVNFTWTFTGEPGEIDWGIKGTAENDFEASQPILSLKNGVQNLKDQEYDGRVNGSQSGNSQSGQVVFTLTAINRNDNKSYRCILRAGFGGSDQVDDVQLNVEGIWF